MKKSIVILAALLIAVLIIAAKNCHNPSSSDWELCERYADNDEQRLRCAIYFNQELIDSTFYPKTNAIK